jgi:biopolymer transport protein ExbB
METVELRLLEVIVDEQHRLEKGLSFIKLSATVAPMLGLLGTVLGMIETFQMISVAGSGDPSVTAGGISTALITTVLGLIAAMPLLLFYTILGSQIERLRVVLEKHSLGLIAVRTEHKEPTFSPIIEANAA